MNNLVKSLAAFALPLLQQLKHSMTRKHAGNT